jgi:hypothetical protein
MGVSGGCGEDTGSEVVCGHGTRLDRGHCVAESTIECGEGTRLVEGACMPIVELSCGEGTVLEGQECVPDESQSELTCGEGTVRDANRCVAQGGVTCGSGTMLDGDECVAVGDEVTCGEGTRLSDGRCVPEDVLTCGAGTMPVDDECVAVGDEVSCGDGTRLSNGECVAEAGLTCGEGTAQDGDECVPEDPVSCGAGTILDGDECIPNDGLSCGAGTVRSGNECVPTSVRCGLGTRIEGDQCVVASTSSIPTSSTFSFQIADKGATSIVYFLDSGGNAVHRYDLAADTFLMPYTLTEPATTMSVTQAGDAVYLGSNGGRVNWIDTSDGEASFLVAAPETPLWIAAVDAYLYLIDGSGSWETHAVYRRSNGERTFADDWRNESNGSAYAPNSKRIFTFRDGSSPNDIYFEVLDPVTGQLGLDVESPYHGAYSLGHPIRVSPDETKVYVASGVVFNSTDLTYGGSIGLSYVDLAFHSDRLYLLRSASSGTSDVVELDANYAVLGRATITGSPLRLFVHDRELTVFTRGSNATIATWQQDL